MKHTECKDCELSNGDCGHHFKSGETTDYVIASLSACDKYGNCMFFKSKAQSYQEPKDYIKNKLDYSRPKGECPYYGGECDYYKFAQTFIDGIVKVMKENHISSFEELSSILGGKEEC